MEEGEEEEELKETTQLEPIMELNEPIEEENSIITDDLEKTASVSVQTDALKHKIEFADTISLEIVSSENETNSIEVEGEFAASEFHYDWRSEFPVTPPPTPKESQYFDIKGLIGEEIGEDYYIPYLPYLPYIPIKSKQVSIDKHEPFIIPRCGEEKKEEEKLPKKRAFFKDETLKEKPGLKIATLDPETEKARAECISYAGVERFAAHFVDTIIDKSIDNIMTSNTYLFSDIEINHLDEESVVTTQPEYLEVYPTYVKWPSIQEFTKELGRSAIDDYMQGWEYAEEWLYCIDFLMEQSDDCSDYYLYDVKWSIPTKPYPIPQATASVYFTIQVCRVKPPHCTVDVTYQFEASRLVHSPGKIIFQEKWLFDIIDAKIELFKQIYF